MRQQQQFMPQADMEQKVDLLMQYKNLNFVHLPGLYVLMNPLNIHRWDCTLFIHSGLYKNSVLLFTLRLNYSPPSVHFLSNYYHPLIDHLGKLDTSLHSHSSIAALLQFVIGIFSLPFMQSITAPVPNSDSLHLVHHNFAAFAELAKTTSILTSSDPILYDQKSSHLIKFRNLDDLEYSLLRSKLHVFWHNLAFRKGTLNLFPSWLAF